MTTRTVTQISVWLDEPAANSEGVDEYYSVSTIDEDGDEIKCIGGYEDLSDAWERGCRAADKYGVDCVEYAESHGGETDRYTPPKCECESCNGCEERPTTTDEGMHLCAECSEYDVDDNGDVHCSRSGWGATCSDCNQAITWGSIQTGNPGQSNWMNGTCGCDDRLWTQTEQGPGNRWRTGYEDGVEVSE